MGKPTTRMIPIFIKELNRHADCKNIGGHIDIIAVTVACRPSKQKFFRVGVSLLRRNRSSEYPATGGTARCNSTGSLEATTRAHE